MSDPGTDKEKVPYDFRESMFGNTKGILGETTADAGKTYGKGPTFTGVDAQGNIIQPKPAKDFGKTDQLEVGKGDTYFRETGPKQQSPFPDDPSKVQEPKRLQPEYGEAYPNMYPTGDEFDPYGGDGMGNDKINQQARITERRGQKPTGKFQGKKVSGNKVSSVTPDAPKAVTSDAGFDLRKAVSDNVAKGMDANRALKDSKTRRTFS